MCIGVLNFNVMFICMDSLTWRGKFLGMCGGNYNLRKDDDFTLRNGTVLNKKDSNQFGNNWAILSGTLLNRLCNVIIFPGYLLFF